METKLFECNECKYSTNIRFCWERHLNSKRHNNTTERVCDVCNYHTKNKFLYNQHLRTKKHLRNVEQNSKEDKHNSNKEGLYENVYKLFDNEICQKDESNQIMKSIIMEFMKQQEKTTNTLLEIAKEPRTITTTTTTTTKQKTFNLNNFLHIECKDAINYSDFLKSIEVNRQDLEYLQANGYTKTYQNIVLKQLQDMEQTKRPLHCIDQKRKKFIIKDKDIWTKENIYAKLRLSIDYFCTALIKEYNAWKDDHPGWKENPEHEIFDISMLMSKEILSPYHSKKKDSIESKVHIHLTELVIDKIQEITGMND
jgi:hypothetical protein